MYRYPRIGCGSGASLEQALTGGCWHSGRFVRDASDRPGGSPVASTPQANPSSAAAPARCAAPPSLSPLHCAHICTRVSQMRSPAGCSHAHLHLPRRSTHGSCSPVHLHTRHPSRHIFSLTFPIYYQPSRCANAWPMQAVEAELPRPPCTLAVCHIVLCKQ